jgi:hypothetical protein
MNQLNTTLSIVVFTACLFAAAVSNAMTRNSAEGSLTVDGKTTAIKHVYFEKSGDQIMIILTDQPVPPEMIPYEISTLSEQGKVRALEFTVSSKTRQLVKHMRRGIYFHPTWTRELTIGNGELTISRLDDTMLAGTIKTPADNDRYGHKFSYNISFSASLKKAPLELTFSGKNDAPSKAYAAYSRAVMAGDIDEFKKYVPGKNLKLMPDDPKEIVLGLEFVQSTMMTDMAILNSEVTGNKAVLTIAGRRGSASADGTVTMLQEDGAWKVSEESWKLNDSKK